MRKLLIASLAAAAAGSAFATPLVYDYKASVKHFYEKEARSNGTAIYVKYVKSAKLQGFFIQDVDGTTTLANSDLSTGNVGTGTGAQSEKRGFLVLMNKSAEKSFRHPKIMPAQLDVKTATTSVTGSGSTIKTKVVAEAYFYAGPFASCPDWAIVWDATYDTATDYLFYYNSTAAAVPANATRSYGTAGSTLYLFGQHNTYNRFIGFDSTAPDNDHLFPSAVQTTGIYAFGDAWMNGAGFGKGSGTTTLCCGWGAVDGGFGTLSGNLKGGLFLCSISGRPANTGLGFFTLGLEDVFADDVALAIGRVAQGEDYTIADEGDQYLWADGDIAMATTDAVSGTWTLKPRSSFNPATLTANEIAWLNAINAAGVLDTDNTLAAGAETCLEVVSYIKAASQSLERNYPLTVGNAAGDTNQPESRNGRDTAGLVPWAFAGLFF